MGYRIQAVRLLIIDDVKDDTTVLALLLRRLCCDVQVCNDPRECVELAESFHPHIILVDYAMPGMSGVEVAQAIRAANLPEPHLLVARTGNTTEQIKRECLDAGFRHVLVKPVDVEQLTALLEEARGQLA